MMSSIGLISKLSVKLCSRIEDVRKEGAKDLYNYITIELRDSSSDEIKNFFDELNKQIYNMLLTDSSNSKLGGIMSIVAVVNADVGITRTRISRFGHYLRNKCLLCSDLNVIYWTTKAMARLMQFSDKYTANVNFNFIEEELTRSFEWLTEEWIELKRYAALLVLREIAISMPSCFYQKISKFFNVIPNCLGDVKPYLRHTAANALRAAFIVMAQRELSSCVISGDNSHYSWYKKCYSHVISEFSAGENEERRVDGALLLLSELLRCSNSKWEFVNREMDYGQNVSPVLVQGATFNNGGFKRYYQKVATATTHSNTGAPVPYDWIGSVNAGDEPIAESSICKQLLIDYYDEMFDRILPFIVDNSHNPLRSSDNVYHTILLILPKLAALQPDIFVKRYLNEIMNLVERLMTRVQRSRFMSQAILTFGLITTAAASFDINRDPVAHIIPYVRNTFSVMRLNLPQPFVAGLSVTASPRRKMRASSTPELNTAIFACVGMLARTFKELIQVEVDSLLNPMMCTGLSESLGLALYKITIHLPRLKPKVIEGLLKILSLILMQQRYRQYGRDDVDMNDIQLLEDEQCVLNSRMIVLALQTLSSFDFSGHPLLPFIRHCSLNYFQWDEMSVRLEAAKTCLSVLRGIFIKDAGKSPVLLTTIGEVIGRLLDLCLSDMDWEVRYCVLQHFDECFDFVLADEQNLSKLFIIINDANFSVREKAICLIGRLSVLNPAFILPCFHTLLIRLLLELEQSGISRNQEYSVRIIGHLAANAPKFVQPYSDSIFKVLIPKLRQTDIGPMVLTSLLRCVGDLAQVSGQSLMRNCFNELFPLLLDMLNDSASSAKREVALWSLSQLIAAAGRPVIPYERYPTLLSTLLAFLRTEVIPSIRAQVLRLLGLLGALDPYRNKIILGLIDTTAAVQSAPLIPINDLNLEMERIYDRTPSEILVNMSFMACPSDYYPYVCLAALIRIMRDSTLVAHHENVVQSIFTMFRALGQKSITFIPQVFPNIITLIRVSNNKLRKCFFDQLGNLIGLVGIHFRPYVKDILSMVVEYWPEDILMQPVILELVGHISNVLRSEFSNYIQDLFPIFMGILVSDPSSDREVTIKLLGALHEFGSFLNTFIHALLPSILKLFDSSMPLSTSSTVRLAALDCIEKMCYSIDFTDQAPIIVHALLRCMENSPTELGIPAIEALTSLVIQLGKNYTMFMPIAHKVITRNKIVHPRYDLICALLYKKGDVGPSDDLESNRIKHRCRSVEKDVLLTTSNTMSFKLNVSTCTLQRAWGASLRVSKGDWLEWHRILANELLKEAPESALRACCRVSSSYGQLALNLFNVSFAACWSRLESREQDELVTSLKQALAVPDLPEITQIVLNLAEFMEHSDKGPLPLDPLILGQQALKCGAYAKALHYKEAEFRCTPTLRVIQSLMDINKKLDQMEAVVGLVEWGRKHQVGNFDMNEIGLNMTNWGEAMASYREESNAGEPIADSEQILTQMRCLEALENWEELEQVANNRWQSSSLNFRRKIAPLAASAAWNCGKLDNLFKFTTLLPTNTQDGNFYRAVQCISQGKWNEAQSFIDIARELLDTEVSALSLESYQRAYPTMICVQMLTEMEEVIEYHLVGHARRSTIREMWSNRLLGCQRVVGNWRRILNVRALVLQPRDNQHNLLKFASLCRKSGRLSLAASTLVALLDRNPAEVDFLQPLPTTNPLATFAYCKYMWDADFRQEAYTQLRHFVKKFLQPAMTSSGGFIQINDGRLVSDAFECGPLLSKCYLKLGQWHESLHESHEETMPQTLIYYASATEYNQTWYKAWHCYAVANFNAVLYFRRRNIHVHTESDDSSSSNIQIATSVITDYAIPALRGFVRSITLCHGSSLQDMLRFLTLLFDYGHQRDMYDALHNGIKEIPIDNWLQVIPQLISRIDSPRQLVNRLVIQLLSDVGRHHPQALVYSLTVASKSATLARKSAAQCVLLKIREHSETLVEQALIVSEELIRVAILWHEQWHDALEEASRLFFNERNIQGMLAVLEPLHELLDAGPQTAKETSFQQIYGNDLNDAYRWTRRYYESLNLRDLNQAWDLYYHVFRRISRQLTQLTQLELKCSSPRLLKCCDLELAVPGSYVPGRPVIRICNILPSLQVFSSKQRPRKLQIRGSNGRTYMFLLKGHEDLRQDERIMQFFSLANSLLLSDRETIRRNLTIQRFAIVPLSTNSGLIGWVPNSDTLHALIKDYREKKKILLNIEHRIMQKMTPDFEHLPLMNKVEVFEHALDLTAGDDLASILILKSPTSESWFERRTNFTRSVAVMSMVGYVLGLGDRHPSNLLLDRVSGKILHIDFGDCFEVAIAREKFPETIPFRLTRMLIKAMEVTGIEGTYRSTCESVMSVLRRNKDSLMTVLEAFVYDPLLNWRLVENTNTGGNKKPGGRNTLVPLDTDCCPLVPARIADESESFNDVIVVRAAGPEFDNTQPVIGLELASAAGLPPEALNKKAVEVLQRVRDKLTGRDFDVQIDTENDMGVREQVELLINQATSNENLCQCYVGWCPFW